MAVFKHKQQMYILLILFITVTSQPQNKPKVSWMENQELKSSISSVAIEETMPFVGPVKGVKMFDYEQIDFFSDRTVGSGTLEGTCTMRSCDGIDLFGSIQDDLSYWRDRGGISAQDLNAAMSISKDLVRITIVKGKLYARNFGNGDASFHIINK
jgi:hypothetical protein